MAVMTQSEKDAEKTAFDQFMELLEEAGETSLELLEKGVQSSIKKATQLSLDAILQSLAEPSGVRLKNLQAKLMEPLGETAKYRVLRDLAENMRGLAAKAVGTPCRRDTRRPGRCFRNGARRPGCSFIGRRRMLRGIFLLKLRLRDINYRNQYRLNDPYGKDFGGDAHIMQERRPPAGRAGVSMKHSEGNQMLEQADFGF